MVQWLAYLLFFIYINHMDTLIRKKYQNEDGIKCSTTCQCFRDKESAICNFTNMDQLKLNIYVKRLTLNNCYGRLDRSSWDRLNTSALTFLKLDHCNVSVQGTDILANLTSLEEVSLNSLPEKVLKSLLIGVNKTNAHILYVAKINVSEFFKSDTFSGLQDSKVINITFAYMDSLYKIKDTFEYFGNCKIFYAIQLRYLININFLAFSKLSFLYMEYLPKLNISYCKYNMTHLKTITSVDNKFDDFHGKYECLPRLKILEIFVSYKNEKNINFPKTFFENLISLQYLKMTSHQFFELKLPNLSSDSLLELKLESFTISLVENTHTYLDFPNLTYLSLVNIRGFRHTLLRNLPKLCKLKLNQLSIPMFPHNMLKWFPNLRALSLSGNPFLTWQYIFYQDMKTLNYLDISNTNLAVLKEYNIPSSVLKTLKKLNASYNPFSCDCESRWFRKFILKHRQKIIDIDKPDSYICHTPVYLYSRHFLANHVPDVDCQHLLDIIIPCTFLIICIVIGGIIFKNRWYIKYIFYTFNTHRKAPLASKGFLYDAFVIYSDEDKDWVHNIMIPKLEIQNNFKLCIHFRNFEVGKFIIDNIVNSINQSKKVILVLSKEFLKSDWCLLEMKLSQDRMLREGPNILVLVTLEDIKKIRIKNNFISSVMNMVTYAEYNIQDKENRVFWSKIIKTLTPDCLKGNENVEEMNETSPLLLN